MEFVEKTGIVVIGRNEGERLKKCLQSIPLNVDHVVYVDSGSNDDSIDFATKAGVAVVLLSCDHMPFSAGRARNSGFAKLLELHPNLEYVQFIDGDCQLYNGWLETALSFMQRKDDVAIVCGRRLELFPDKSIYNLLCDIEWNTSIGEAESCGGDFLVRRCDFWEVNGFNSSVIAGEEPDLCYRLRQNGRRIFRIDHDMTYHDAAMTKFSQWWKRTVRSGHAYAQGYYLHGRGGAGYCLRDCLRIWTWALLLPVLIIGLVMLFGVKLLIVTIAYPLLFLKIAWNCRKNKFSIKNSIIYSFYIILGKWPQLIGQLVFLRRLLLKEQLTIMEY